MHLFDKLTIDGTRRTNDGYLAVNARVARAGNVQVYAGAEVGRPDLASVRVFRPEAEVFSKDTLKSFARRPVTLGHPSSPVTSDNWHQVAKGWSDGEVARDGEFIRVSMLLADADAIRAVEGGTRELSAGYDCELIWEDGTSPTGERYDARQVSIRGNHVALVAAARGGSQLRIGDSAMQPIVDARTGMIDQAVVDAEAAKPEYDGYRGLFGDGGEPMERQMAISNLIRNSPVGQRAEAMRDHMAHQMGLGHLPPVNDNRPEPQFAKDGRPMSALSDSERAYERMTADLAGAHRN